MEAKKKLPVKGKRELTVAKRLYADAQKLQMRITGDLKLDIIFIGSGHPKRNSATLDKGAGCKIEDIVQHCVEAVGLFGCDEPVQTGCKGGMTWIC